MNGAPVSPGAAQSVTDGEVYQHGTYYKKQVFRVPVAVKEQRSEHQPGLPENSQPPSIEQIIQCDYNGKEEEYVCGGVKEHR